MLSVNTVIPASLQRSYTARNGGAGKFHEFIRSQSAVGHTGPSVVASWLVIKGGTGADNGQLWDSYLASKGFSAGPLKDRMKAFFRTGTQA